MTVQAAEQNGILLRPLWQPFHHRGVAWPFQPGLHIVLGGPATFKSVNTLAYTLHQRSLGNTAVYAPVGEPRGLVFMNGAGVRDTSISATASYGNWLISQLTSLSSQSFSPEARNREVAVPPPLLVLDSLTFLLRRAGPTVAELSSERGGATYAGGLDYAALLGALHHDALARMQGVALFGIINTSLFPVAEGLIGACEGVIRSNAMGQFSYNTRSVGRTARPLHIPATATADALQLLYANSSPPSGALSTSEI